MDREPRRASSASSRCAPRRASSFRAPLATSPALAAALSPLRADVAAAGGGPLPRPRPRGGGGARARRRAAQRALRRRIPGTRGHDAGRGRAAATRRSSWPAAFRHRAARRGRGGAERDRPRLADTDWHIDRLYDGRCPARPTVRANFPRYVIDVNRDPAGASLYPGQDTTGLCPTTDFDGEPIWRASARRRPRSPTGVAPFHAPYHAALARAVDGSARSRLRHALRLPLDPLPYPVPLRGHAAGLQHRHHRRAPARPGGGGGSAVSSGAGATCLTYVVNGRFKGGWITRHYGRPEERARHPDGARAGDLPRARPPPWASEATAAEVRAPSARRARDPDCRRRAT